MKIERIQKSYKNQLILDDVSFEAGAGQCIGILGCNGSGKSTLLSILAGIIKADGGKFLYGEHDLLRESKLRARIVGYVPQSTPLLEELTARDNLSLWYTPESMEQELTGGVLSMLGIDAFIKTAVHKMSGGMKKRLSIGCAVGHKPKVLLLDEPSAALDLVCKDRIAQYLLEYKSAGNTVILATHDLQELPLCDRLFVLKQGVLRPIQFDGDVQELVGML